MRKRILMLVFATTLTVIALLAKNADACDGQYMQCRPWGGHPGGYCCVACNGTVNCSGG